MKVEYVKEIVIRLNQQEHYKMIRILEKFIEVCEAMDEMDTTLDDEYGLAHELNCQLSKGE